jgi:hypothetical protein
MSAGHAGSMSLNHRQASFINFSEFCIISIDPEKGELIALMIASNISVVNNIPF